MTKYDVELITDKHGKPLPQYYDEQEGEMKPITHDNFNGQIVGDVNAVVEFPDVQKVEVTNPVDTVSVDNLPDVQKVEITNAQSQIDVNVLNPVESVSVTNLPSNQEVTVTNPVELPSEYNVNVLNIPTPDFKEYRLLSTDTKPVANKGDVLFEIDTGKVFMFGTDWGEI